MLLFVFNIGFNFLTILDQLVFNTSCVRNYKCIHFCGVASEQLNKQSVQKNSQQAKRTLLQTLDLISSWKSEETKLYPFPSDFIKKIALLTFTFSIAFTKN